jgi:hypothetical protein
MERAEVQGMAATVDMWRCSPRLSPVHHLFASQLGAGFQQGIAVSCACYKDRRGSARKGSPSCKFQFHGSTAASPNLAASTPSS